MGARRTDEASGVRAVAATGLRVAEETREEGLVVVGLVAAEVGMGRTLAEGMGRVERREEGLVVERPLRTVGVAAVVLAGVVAGREGARMEADAVEGVRAKVEEEEEAMAGLLVPLTSVEVGRAAEIGGREAEADVLAGTRRAGAVIDEVVMGDGDGLAVGRAGLGRPRSSSSSESVRCHVYMQRGMVSSRGSQTFEASEARHTDRCSSVGFARTFRADSAHRSRPRGAHGPPRPSARRTKEGGT